MTSGEAGVEEVEASEVVEMVEDEAEVVETANLRYSVLSGCCTTKLLQLNSFEYDWLLFILCLYCR